MDKLDVTPFVSDKAALIVELEAAGAIKAKERDKFTCCFHNEKTGSLSVFERGGRWSYHCFGCDKSGDIFDIMAHNQKKTPAEIILGLNPSAQKKAPEKSIVYNTFEKLEASVKWNHCKDGAVLEDCYKYTHPITRAIDLAVFRIRTGEHSKKFVQASQCEGGFVARNLCAKNPLFNRLRVASAEFIIVVEGEKKVKALHTLGITATCSPGGSNAAPNADWTPLSGKTIVIWRDNDKPGERYANSVVAETQKLTPPALVRLIDVDKLKLPPGGDACDFIARYSDTEECKLAVAEVLTSAREIGPLSGLDEDIADAIAGRRVCLPFPWPALTVLTRALLPGTVTLFAGNPGATKSLALLQHIRSLIAAGVPSAVMELEDTPAYHLRRALAQIAKESNVTIDEWCKQHPEDVEKHRAAAKEELNALAACISSPATMGDLTVDALLEWVRKQAMSGKKFIAIDPITAMTRGRFGWTDDERFLLGAKQIIQEYKAALLLITHPRKAPTGQCAPVQLSDTAGGAAFERFSQCVVFLMAHEPESENVKNQCGITTENINRTLIILKARNGPGAGKKIGYWFDSSSLTLREVGEFT